MMINVREFTNGYINTDTVQRAIDYAAENKKVLYFPAGIYRTSSLFLKSNSSLYLDENAVLSALTDEEDWKNSKLTPFIYGKDAENISLRGKGVICCNGRFFVGEKGERKKTEFRPERTVVMQNCRNVIIESITVVETIGWSIHLDNCEDVFVEGVIVRNPTQEIIRNADGIDINGCRNVTVLNCDIETGDDAICLKNIDYTDNKTRLDYPRPDMYNISVYNCKMASTCNCAKIGTETVGNIYNVSFEKIQIFKHSGVNHDNQNKSSGTLGAPISAISVQSNDGGAVYNVKFKDIYAEEVDTPIFIECQCRDYYTKNNQNGYISDVEIDGLYVKKCYRNSQVISEKHGKINNVSISRVFAESYEAPNLEYHYRLKPINGYPDPENYGKFPAFGLFSINSKNVKIDKNVVFVDSGKSGRDAIIVENEHE